MKKYTFLLLLCLLFLFNNLYSVKHTSIDTSQVYNYWAHRSIVEMVFADMNDYINNIEGTIPKEKTISIKDYRINFLDSINNESLPDIKKVALFLDNNNWKEINENTLEPLYSNFTRGKALNHAFFDIKADAESHTKEHNMWNEKKTELLELYNVNLNQTLKEDNAYEDNTFQFEESSISFNKTYLFLYSLIFFIGLIIGAFAVFIFSKKKIYKILREERVYYLDYPPLKNEKSIFHYITLFHILKRRKDSYKIRNAQLRQQMEELTSGSKLDETEK